MRSVEEFDSVRQLIASGMNDCAIARQVGVPRCTVRDWRVRQQIQARPISTSACGRLHHFAALPAAVYSYLLGLYLVTDASHGTPEPGGQGSFSTTNTPGSLNDAARLWMP